MWLLVAARGYYCLISRWLGRIEEECEEKRHDAGVIHERLLRRDGNGIVLTCAGGRGVRKCQNCIQGRWGIHYKKDNLVRIQVMKWYSPTVEAMKTKATTTTP